MTRYGETPGLAKVCATGIKDSQQRGRPLFFLSVVQSGVNIMFFHVEWERATAVPNIPVIWEVEKRGLGQFRGSAPW